MGSPKKASKKITKTPAKAAGEKSALARKKVKRALSKASSKSGGAAKTASGKQVAPVKSRLSKKDLAMFREKLLALRDRVIDEIGFLTGDNLNRSQRDASGDLSSYSYHMADQGTDNFDREFALNLASSEQDTLYEIDEALARLDAGTFGICEMCGCAIEKVRLLAMPYARMCVKCKAQAEKGKARYRPFGPTLSQTIPAE